MYNTKRVSINRKKVVKDTVLKQGYLAWKELLGIVSIHMKKYEKLITLIFVAEKANSYIGESEWQKGNEIMKTIIEKFFNSNIFCQKYTM